MPGKVVAIDDSTDPLTGLVDFGGVQKQACLEYVRDVRVGEYVIVHVGFALQRLDENRLWPPAALRGAGAAGGGVRRRLGAGGEGGGSPVRYLDEFNDPGLARRLLDEIRATATRPWALMEVCGGQTHSIIRHGIDQLLPEQVELIHGPGCPVCVTPLEVIDRALEIASRPGVIFCSFGDMLRVPGSDRDLFRVKGEGGDVRVVYSPLDALELARRHRTGRWSSSPSVSRPRPRQRDGRAPGTPPRPDQLQPPGVARAGASAIEAIMTAPPAGCRASWPPGTCAA